MVIAQQVFRRFGGIQKFGQILHVLVKCFKNVRCGKHCMGMVIYRKKTAERNSTIQNKIATKLKRGSPPLALPELLC